MSKYLKLIRVKHWIKNLLVFLPVFFSGNIFLTEKSSLLVLAFFSFCFVSSIVYVVNDIKDIEKDRKHPVKKTRPLASGAISKSQALIIVALLTLAALASSVALCLLTDNPLAFFIPLIYLALNIAYSLKLKQIPIIDVGIIVAGFVLRVVYGGIVSNIEASKYLYLMIIFGASFLGFGKRRNEIIKNGVQSRSVLEKYNKNFLDKNMYVSLGLTITAYLLWCTSTTNISNPGYPYLFWTVPILLIIVQLYSLDIERDSHGDPVDVITSDKLLLSLILLYAIIMVIIIYII